MADVFTREKRSFVMSKIRSAGNRDTELRMITLFKAAGISHWRRNVALFGRPDFAFPRERIAVFVDGCFWHRHPRCKFAYTPKSRTEFWLRKFDSNVARDRLVTRNLRKAGWRIIRVWECELTPQKSIRPIARIERALKKRIGSRYKRAPLPAAKCLPKPAKFGSQRVSESLMP